MNGPDEHDDDPDGVTLWSGRLRAWPVAPDPVGNEDDTVRTPRTTSGGGAASSRAVEHDVRAPSPGDTALSRAVEHDGPPPSPSALADHHRSPSARDDVAAPSVPDADTAPSRSRTPRAEAGRPLVGDTSETPAETEGPSPASDVDTSTAPRAGIEPRRAASVADTEFDSRPRGVRRIVPAADGQPPAQREARSPVALQRESYAPRLDEPARVARASTGGEARSGDAGLVHPRRSPGRAVLIVLTVAVVAVAVVVLAAVGVALLLG